MEFPRRRSLLALFSLVPRDFLRACPLLSKQANNLTDPESCLSQSKRVCRALVPFRFLFLFFFFACDCTGGDDHDLPAFSRDFSFSLKVAFLSMSAEFSANFSRCRIVSISLFCGLGPNADRSGSLSDVYRAAKCDSLVSHLSSLVVECTSFPADAHLGHYSFFLSRVRPIFTRLFSLLLFFRAGYK